MNDLMMVRYSLEELGVGCRDNINTDPTNIGWEGVAWINTLLTGDADLRFYVTTVQDG